MANRAELPVVAAVGVWLTSVIGFGVMAAALLGAVFADFLACDIGEVTDPADTSLGWLIASSATLLPVGVAAAVAASRIRVPLLLVALSVAVFEIWMWWWALSPVCQADLVSLAMGAR